MSALYGDDQDFTSEVPTNLPANRQDPEFGSDVIVDLLNQMGIDYLPLTPGSSFRGIHDSLVNYGRNHKPQLILCAHEEIAVHMAQGYAKATGKTGVVFLHDLVGVQHGLMALYNAYADRQPMLVLGGSGPADPKDRRAIDWIHSANSQSELARPYTKWSDDPSTLQATLDSILRAYRIAGSAPTRPTYVSIDTNLQEDKVTEADYRIPDPKAGYYQPAPPLAAPADSIAAAADVLIEAAMPLIFAGRTGLDSRLTQPLVELVELTGAAYQDSGDTVNFPTNNPHNLTGGFGPTKETEILGLSDTILAIDCQDVVGIMGGYAKARGGWDAGRAGQQKAPPKLIDLSLNDFTIESWSNIGGALPPMDVQLLCDPIYGLGQLLAELKGRAAGNPAWVKRAKDRSAEIAQRHETLRARQREAVQELWNERPISPARMMGELWQAVRDKDFVMGLRNGRSWYEGIWEFKGAGQFLGSNGGGGVGYGAGGVLGSALAARDAGKFSVSILGDGDFTMGPAALWTAAHYKIPALIVLHNNNSFGNDEEHQITLAEMRDRPIENAWIGQRMAGPSPDYAMIARGYGAWGEGPVTDPEDLAGVFRRAVEEVDKGGIALIDVRTMLK